MLCFFNRKTKNSSWKNLYIFMVSSINVLEFTLKWNSKINCLELKHFFSRTFSLCFFYKILWFFKRNKISFLGGIYSVFFHHIFFTWGSVYFWICFNDSAIYCLSGSRPDLRWGVYLRDQRLTLINVDISDKLQSPQISYPKSSTSRHWFSPALCMKRVSVKYSR